MKRIFFLIASLNLSGLLHANQPNNLNHPQPATQKYEDNTPATLGRIAAIVSFFSNVIANPNDHKNVATSILGIISTIFTIAADTRNPNFNYLELQNEIINILQTGKPQEIAMLQDMIKTACDLQIENLQNYINPNLI